MIQRCALALGVVLCALTGTAFAQDEVPAAEPQVQAEPLVQEQPMQPVATASPKGVGTYNSNDLATILPAAGDIAIGLDGSPILNYFGNMFNNSTNNDTKAYLNNLTPVVYMRYYLTDKLAIRARLQWRGTKNVTTYHTPDQSALAKDPTSKLEVEDRYVVRGNRWLFGAGAQYFRGYGRLRGFVGADIDYRIMRSTFNAYYGNKMSLDNKTPQTTDQNGNLKEMGERTLKASDGWQHEIGLAVFAGVEYYFLPKMCIGIETGATLNATLRGKQKSYSEKVVGDVYHGDWETTKRANGDDVELEVATMTPGNHFYANFYFMFHF